MERVSSAGDASHGKNDPDGLPLLRRGMPYQSRHRKRQDPSCGRREWADQREPALPEGHVWLGISQRHQDPDAAPEKTDAAHFPQRRFQGSVVGRGDRIHLKPIERDQAKIRTGRHHGDGLRAWPRQRGQLRDAEIRRGRWSAPTTSITAPEYDTPLPWPVWPQRLAMGQ